MGIAGPLAKSAAGRLARTGGPHCCAPMFSMLLKGAVSPTARSLNNSP